VRCARESVPPDPVVKIIRPNDGTPRMVNRLGTPGGAGCLEGVTLYHHLLLDSADHVEAVQSVAAESDEDAKAYAAKLLPPAGRIAAVEVWQGHRRVYRVQNPSL
jgi:hypothetical protein